MATTISEAYLRLLEALHEKNALPSQDVAVKLDKSKFSMSPGETIEFVKNVERALEKLARHGLAERIDGSPPRWARTPVGTKALEAHRP